MKPADTSYMSNVVGLYLRERCYSDSDFYEKSEDKLVQTFREMAKDSDMEIMWNALDSVNYGSPNIYFSSANKQYTQLHSFIGKSPEPFKSELSQFVYPMFVQMYLELVVNKKWQDAHKFWHGHSFIYLKTDGYKELVLELKAIKTPQDVASHKYFHLFRTDKFVVKMSLDCAEYFIEYLKKLKHTIVIQFINLYFLIEESEESTATFRIEDSSLNMQSVECESTSASDSKKSLEDCIKKVSEMPPCLPAIYLYSLTNVKNVCSADLSSNNEMLASGLEDSSIRLYHFTPPWSMKECFTKEDENDTDITEAVTVFRGHIAPVYGIAFTPSSDLLFSCSGDKTVRAWTLDTYETTVIYAGHQREIWDLDICPMSWYFATASKDHKALLWAMERPYPLNSFIGHNSEVNCVKFHPNCNYVATGSSDETIRLWSAQDGRMVRVLSGHRGGVHAIAFSPNGMHLASAGEDRKIKIWDIGSATVIKDLNAHTDLVHSLNFNNDGSLLASAGSESSIRLFDVQDCRSSLRASSSKSVDSPCKSSFHKGTKSNELPPFHAGNTSVELIRFGWKNLLLAVGVES